jgi:retinol dehydrogenase 12
MNAPATSTTPRLRLPRRSPPAVPLHDMKGRVAVVTGASAGIGLETARGLAARGAVVCMVGRNRPKTEAAVAEIAASTGNRGVSFLCGDFGDLEQVRRLAAELLERFPEIHVLVNNAGLWVKHRELGRDGVNTTFTVNHLAPFLLTNLLLSRLRESAPARIVTVSSRLHIRERGIRFQDIGSEQRFAGLRAYRQSKLANVLFAAELARRLQGSGVTSNSVHPGDVATEVVRDSRFLTAGLEWIGRLFLLTPEEGARTTLHVATSPDLESVSGRYFASCRAVPASPEGQDPELAARLWEESARLTGIDPG